MIDMIVFFENKVILAHANTPTIVLEVNTEKVYHDGAIFYVKPYTLCIRSLDNKKCTELKKTKKGFSICNIADGKLTEFSIANGRVYETCGGVWHCLGNALWID